MNKIKFRAKAKNMNKWVYGDLLHPKTSRFNNYAIFEFTGGCVSVKPHTIGMFTGLYDFHGKEIYQGDILKLQTGTIVMVIYNKDRFIYQKIKKPHTNTTRNALKQGNVIGNVYENKYLLGGQ